MFSNDFHKSSIVTLLQKFLAILPFIYFFPTTSASAITINEFVPDSDTEWVEFYNASDSADYIKSFFLDDDTSFTEDSGSTNKKNLSSLNTTNTTFPFIEVSTIFNNSGDFVVLFDDLGNILDQYQYTSNPGDGISIGRNPDGSGSFAVLSSTTKGGPNSPPPTPTPTPTPIPPTHTPNPTSPPAPTSTPKPTSTSKPASTSTPRPTPSSSPRPTVKIPTPTPFPETTLPVLGEAAEFFTTSTPYPPIELSENGNSSKTSPNWPAFILIGLGVLGLGVSAFLFFKSHP